MATVFGYQGLIMTFRTFQLTTASFGLLLLAGCAASVPPGPPTGWISFDPATSQGTFIRSDGARWVGGYKDGHFDGRGTLYWAKQYDDSGYVTRAIPEGYAHASFRRDAKNGEWAAGPITVVVPAVGDIWGFTFKGQTDGYGLKGPGKLVRTDGFTLEGDFDYGEMPIATLDSDGYFVWNNYQMLASYAHGSVKATWPNGATFEGETLDHYPFNRSSKAVTCLPSYFYGNGLLKRPGKADYIGLVSENGPVGPVTKADFLDHIENFGDCPAEALAKQSEINNRQAAYDAEMEEGRQRANAMLAADMSALSSKIANDMARVESASRGSSVELDQENARKSARLREIHAEHQAEAKPTAQRKNDAQPVKRSSPATATSGASVATSPSSTPATNAALATGTRAAWTGQLYVVVYTAFKHNKTDSKNVMLVEKITPVNWTFNGYRVSSSEPADGATAIYPIQVETRARQKVLAQYRSYIDSLSAYPSCSGATPTGQACYARTPYIQIGRSAAEVEQKLQGVGAPSWSNVVQSAAFGYPSTVSVRE